MRSFILSIPGFEIDDVLELFAALKALQQLCKSGLGEYIHFGPTTQDVLDTGSLGTMESSMTKASVSELLYRVADRCVQVMGGTGVSKDTVVEQIFREIRAFRIYDGPTEVHKWSIAKKIKRDAAEANRP